MSSSEPAAVPPLIAQTRDELARALAGMDEPVVGVDVERADAPRYFRRAALIQVGTASSVVLVDPLALSPVPLLGDFLAERVAVLHAIHNDLEPLRAAGVEVDRAEDTAVAASLLGLPVGLDPLLQETLGVALSPDKDRFQRANWEQRPLPEDMAAYAAGDVVHLPQLWAELGQRLDEVGRSTWYDEERDVVIAGAWEDTRSWTRTKGAGRLTPRQRAVLRALWEEREAIARDEDLAPNRVLREQVLVDLAVRPTTSAAGVVRRNQRRGKPGPEHAARLFAALVAGAEAPEEPRNGSGRWTSENRAAYDALRNRRAAVADELGLDPGVLCPSRALWGPVRAHPASAEELCELAGLRAWQAGVLREPLWEAYLAAVGDGASGDGASGDGPADGSASS